MKARKGDGWLVHYSAISEEKCREALRAINLHMMRRGLMAGEIEQWRKDGKWFWPMTDPGYPPSKPVLALADGFPEVEVRWTQILLQFPSESDNEPSFHTDDEPVGLTLKRIVFVPLTLSGANFGGLTFVDGQPIVWPGDMIEFENVPHHGGVNKSGAIRYAVYFREFERSA